MKHFVAGIMFFQVCGNDLIIIQDNSPHTVCGMVSQICSPLDMTKLLLIRKTSSCSLLQEFKVVE